MNRREFIRTSVAGALFLGTAALAAFELVPELRGQPQAEQASGQSAPDGYAFVVALANLGDLTMLAFQHPVFGNSWLVSFDGGWKAFSSTCTHEVCTVQVDGSEFRCPCHGATFSIEDGAVLGGPAPRPLPEYGVEVIGGNVYATLAAIN